MLGAAVVACAAAGAFVQSLPEPIPIRPAAAAGAASASPAAPKPPRYQDAEAAYPLSEDIGKPLPGGGEPNRQRTFFGTSGRGQAWLGTIRQAEQRPLLGYGFGTEQKVFVDRYYSFEGGVPENSYVGMFLQLGAVGEAVFLVLLGSLVLAAGRALVPVDPDGRALAATCGAVLFVGLALALFQSYLYAAGNNATLSVWVCAFLLTALTLLLMAIGRAFGLDKLYTGVDPATRADYERRLRGG